MVNPLDGKKLELQYPVSWTYKLIGSDASRMTVAVTETLGDRHYELSHSNKSATGRYCSLTLIVTVESERQRLDFGDRLHAHADIRFVL